jgi:multidrug resistance efflux pump
VERARADVRQIENQLAQQSVQLAETRIVAPISGDVTGKYQEEGELIASATAGFAQGAAVVSIADLSKMLVRVNINEVDVARVKVGQPVEISVDSVPGKRFAGRVSSISAAAIGKSLKRDVAASAQSSGTGGVVRFEVKVTVGNADRRLRPGMTAVVDIILDRHKNVLTLPAESIKPGNKVAVVTGPAKEQKATDAKITTGLKNDAEVEILSGVSEGDTVEIPKINAKDRRKIEFDGPD